MIYETIKEMLGRADGLSEEHIYPAGVVLDDVERPCCLYTFAEQEPVRDLSGEVHHWETRVLVDFFASTFDEVHALYDSAANVFLAAINWEDGHGHVIFSATPRSREPDNVIPDLSLMHRSMEVQLLWCDIEEDEL